MSTDNYSGSMYLNKPLISVLRPLCNGCAQMCVFRQLDNAYSETSYHSLRPCENPILSSILQHDVSGIVLALKQ